MKFLALLFSLIVVSSAQASCPGDANSDLRVDVKDIMVVLSNWTPNNLTGGFDFPVGDVNYDGYVDAGDLTLIISMWGLGGPTNPNSCYPFGAPLDASHECIASVISQRPSCGGWWDSECDDLLCQQIDCLGPWCP